MQAHFKHAGVRMARIEKTVFISYRRTNLPWALAVYQNLTHRGYDVFFDYESINSGDFEKIIIGNIRARAHFIVILTPSALERCVNADDWLRREIETALAEKRNIVPLFLEGFNFGSPSISKYLTGKMALLKNYNGLNVPVDYFEEAMGKLCQRFLNVSLDAVLHPLSSTVEQAVKVQKIATNKAPEVTEKELTAQEWFEKGLKLNDHSEEELHCYTEAIHLQPNSPGAYNNRGIVRKAQGDLDGALMDYTEAIRLKPDYAIAYFNRGNICKDKGDLNQAIKDYTETLRFDPNYRAAYYNRGTTRHEVGDLNGAIKDLSESIRLDPHDHDAYYNRGLARYSKKDFDGAIQDYTEAIRLKPDHASAYYNRGLARYSKKDLDGALKDYTEAIRFKPDKANAHYNRAVVWEEKREYQGAIADYQKYLDLGFGLRNGDQSEVEEAIRKLKKKIK
jgi:tetratricopeptide (TPR) repeat protein